MQEYDLYVYEQEKEIHLTMHHTIVKSVVDTFNDHRWIYIAWDHI